MSKVNFKYENGDVLKDKVTGLTGVVVVRAEYSTGCHHYGIQARQTKDAKEPDWVWHDQSRLELVAAGVVTFNIEEKAPSGAFPSGPEA